MYAKLFASIYQGTLRGNTNCLVVFTNLLAHADSQGWVDIHPRAISEEVGLTQEQVCDALNQLESPDRDSRSPEEDGRRIMRLDEHRSWGWRIVNYGKYRAIRNEEDRREQNRLAQERYRQRNADSNKSKPRKPRSAQAEAEAEAEAEEEKNTDYVRMSSPQGGKSLPPCPVEKIAEEYHRLLPELPSIVVVNKTRRAHVQARWREVCAEDGLDTEGGLEFFRDYFGKIRRSKFLMGKAPATNGRGPFRADFDWIFNPQNFLKIIEGRYDVQDKGKGT